MDNPNNTLGFDSLSSLAHELNSRLEIGRGITFHNEPSLLIKHPSKPSVLFLHCKYSSVAPGLTMDRDGGRGGFKFSCYNVFPFENEFFRPSIEGEPVGSHTITKAPKDVLVYGPRDMPFGTSMTSYFSTQLDSAKYGPIVYEIEEKSKDLFELANSERLFWDRIER